ncbi:hypothetical protein LTR53_001386, partial [Teratosphaeriaceae sp. CCFEE 6253]
TRGGYGLPPYMQHMQPMQFSAMPNPPPGVPTFDPNDPLAAMMAMGQAMGFLPPTPDFGLQNGLDATRAADRCRDYDTKGFCVRGASCPYEHDDNTVIVAQQSDEYDPSNAMMFDTTSNQAGHSQDFLPRATGASGRGGGGGRVSRGGRRREEVSARGMSFDRNITSIVVEPIPEEHFDEDSVRTFFGAFGSVEEVTLQSHKRLAIVRYDSYESAKAAYSSPKSVFDNRFVKVYWHKPANVPQARSIHLMASASEDVQMARDEPDFNYEEFARRQRDVQQKYEEACREREGVQQRRQELVVKLEAIEAERKRMADLISKKTGRPAISHSEDEETARLRARLAELQSEALSLGIDPDADDVPSASFAPPDRGRGGYKGRFPSRGRGHYQASYRGGYGGSGFNVGRTTMSLDNRPKTITVTFAEGRYREHEEALRQYLMFNGLETATLAKHPGRDDAVLVTFQQRYEAENVMAAVVYSGPLAATDLPKQLGKVGLAWYKVEDVVPDGLGEDVGKQEDGQPKVEEEDREATMERPGEYEHTAREDRDMDTYDE